MTMLELEMIALDAARAAAGLCTNWLIQSTLLIVMGLWIGALLRTKGSAAQSAVYRTTLAAVMVCPLVTWGLSRFGASGWSLEMPAAYAHEQRGEPPVETPAASEMFAQATSDAMVEINAQGETLDSLSYAGSTEFWEAQSPVDLLAGQAPPDNVLGADETLPTAPELAAVENASAPAPQSTSVLAIHWFGAAAITASAIWIAISLALLVRLAWSWRQLIRLRRGAWPADTETRNACRQVASLFRVAPPDVLHSPYLPSPCLAGLRRPAVLLPEADSSLPVRDVLIHELAHLARGDCYWNLVRRMGSAMLFFQPLMWLLSRRLDSTAEEVCDDYVVQLGGDRREYAHRLVNIAELSLAPMSAAGVGIVSLRSMLAARVARIMDTSRSLSTRVGHALLAFVLLAGLAGTMLVGLVGVEPDSAVAEANPESEAAIKEAQEETAQTDDEDTGAAEAASEESGQDADGDVTPIDALASDTPATARVTGSIQLIDSETAKAKANNDDELSMTKVRGRVVDDTGQPVSGALVRVMRKKPSLKNEHELLDEERSVSDGSFEVTMPGTDGVPQWMHRRDPQSTTYLTSIVATAPGYAAGWAGRTQQLQSPNDDGKTGDLVLRLSKQPATIRGQLVNLEGQPVAGAIVQINAIATAEPGAVDQWLATVKRLRAEGKLPKPSSRADYTVFTSAMVIDRNSTLTKQTDDPYFPQKYQVSVGHPEFPAAVTTDDDGRFEIAGLAPDQLVGLFISGPDIVAHNIIAVTREMEALDLPHTSVANSFTNGYYGSTFSHPVAPGIAVGGVIKDAESGEPLPGMGVSAVPVMNNVWTHNPAWHGVTEGNGAFRIEGLPADTKILLSIDPPGGAPYLAVEHFEVPQGKPLEATEVEIKFRRGVVVRGKVTDAVTGEPVDATLHYHPFLDNEHAKSYQRYQTDSLHVDLNNRRYSTGKDGTFETVAIPGRGILAVHATDRGEFCIGLGAEAIGGLDQSRRFPTHDYCSPSLYHRLLEIDVPADAVEVHHDVTVSRGATVKYLVTDDEGQLLRGILATGSTAFGGAQTSESEDASVEVKALRPDEKRRVAFLHRERRLGRIIDVAAPQYSSSNEEPQEVALLLCGTVSGKLINAEGEPVINASVSARTLPLRDGNSLTPQQTLTDDNGQFHLEYLPVGAAYQITGNGREVRFFELAKDLTFEPGESVDLGMIDVTKKDRPEPKRTTAQTSSTVSPVAGDSGDVITVRGSVVDPDGKPFGGATVQILRWYWDPNVERKPLATATSDSAGRFTISFRKSQFDVDLRRPDMWKEATIVASSPGYGPDFQSLRDRDPASELALRLVRDDVPVSGRLVDLEGNPLAGVTVRIGGLAAADDEDLTPWLDAVGRGEIIWQAANAHLDKVTPHNPADLPSELTTDGDGRFRITGAGRERRINLEFTGPMIAHSTATVVTRKMPPIDGRDGMPDPEWSQRRTIYGADFEIALMPTQPIVGTVRDATTGEPLAGVEVHSYRMTERGISAGKTIRVKSDEQGRYRLVGMPKGSGRQIIAVPNDEQPYLMREFDVPDQPGLEAVECNLDLHRGVWISGRITDKQTGKPVGTPAQVWMYYLPFRDNRFAQALPEYDSDGNTDGYQDRYQVRADGTYRLVGLPGRAIIGLSCWHQGYPDGMGSDLIEGIEEKTGHFNTYRAPLSPSRKWPTAMKEVNIAEGAAQVELDFELDAGRSVQFTIVDSAGNEVQGASVRGAKGHSSGRQEIEGASVVAIGLTPPVKRTILFHHKQRNIGQIIRAEAIGDVAEPVKVTLDPCATIRGRLTDDNEVPITGATIRLAPRPGGDFEPELENIATDSDGRFEHTAVLPGADYAIFSESTQFGFKVVAEKLAIKPGETVDLGTIDLTAKERPEPKRMMTGSAVGETAIRAPIGTSGGSSAKNGAITVRGRIVAEDGKPIAGAEVRLPDDVSTDVQTSNADADGNFQIVFDKAKFTKPEWHERPWQNARLIAEADGFAPCWIEGKDLAAESNVTITLKRDNIPIRGTILTPEGQPVPRARLEVETVYEPVRGGLDGLLKTIRDDPNIAQSYMNREMRYLLGRLLLPQLTQGTLSRDENGNPIITTDDQGRFELRGIGPERVLRLSLKGTSIQSTQLHVATRATIDDQWKRASLDEQSRMMLDAGSALPQLEPATFQYLAGPSVPIRGIVRDKETGKPLAGIPVGGWLRNTDNHAYATTDENGRYELNGLGVEGTFQQLYAGPGEKDVERLPYLGGHKSQITYSPAAPLNEKDTTFELSRGIVVRGTVKDAATGEPVKARVEYMGTDDNPFISTLADDLWPYGDPITNDRGEFTIVVPPGPGALAVWTTLTSDLPDRYRPVDPKAFGLPIDKRGWISTTNRGLVHPWSYKAAKFIDSHPDDVPPALNLVVEPITDLARVRCVDENGRTLDDVRVIGHLPWRGNYAAIAPQSGLDNGTGDDAYIEIAELAADARKPVVFSTRDRDKAGILFPSHSRLQPRLSDLKVAGDGVHLLPLAPAAMIRGRLVDADGNPVRSAGTEIAIVPDSNFTATQMEIEDAATDQEGRFELRGLPAGGPFWLAGGNQSAGGILKRDIQLTAGQQLDLGDIDISKAERPADNQSQSAAASSSKPATKSIPALSAPQSQAGPFATKSATDPALHLVHGRVVGPDGQPAARAHVAVIGASTRERRGGDLDYRDDVLAEATTNADGTYQLSLAGISSRTHEWVSLVARAEGAGLAWRRLDPNARGVDTSFELAAEEPIRGRLVDIEGQPAAGVRMSIAAVMPTTTDGKFVDGIGYRNSTTFPAAWPSSMTTDAAGRFAIRGIPVGHGVFIRVQGDDRFAPQDISLNTGMPEVRGERDGTYRALVKNLKPDEEAVLALAPAQVFEGMVRYEDTGQPAPHARLTIWASQQKFGSMVSVPGKADAQGRYRMSPHPGIRFGVTAYPPDGAAYLTRRLPEVDWDDAAKVKHVDVTLPRGVLVRGKVIDVSSGAPVAGATIQYVPEADNNANDADDILTGWQGIQLSNERGEFEIVVLPGPGSLVVHGTQDEFVIRETSSLQLMRGRSGGARYYANAIERIDPETGADPIDVTIELERGAKIAGQLVNEAGEPVDEALMITRLNIVPTTLSWRGDASKHVLGGRFVLSPLEPGEKYTVHFLDAKRRLSATVTLSTDDPTPMVVLKPCGQAIARFVDEDGEPLADIRPGLHMVVTPGVNELDFEARKRGELVADTDFLANIDRVNHWDRPPTDKDGRTAFPALIPGATYRILRSVKGEPEIAKEFAVKSQQSLDLGEIVLERKD